jgi:hypothetical protein
MLAGTEFSVTTQLEEHDDAASTPTRVTVFLNSDGLLGKTVYVTDDGSVDKTPTSHLVQGKCRTEVVGNVAELVDLHRSLKPTRALCYGVYPDAVVGQVRVVTAQDRADQQPGAVTRVANAMVWDDGPGFWFLDFDGRNPAEPLDEDPTVLRAKLIAAEPALALAPMGWTPSASADIYDETTGELRRGLTGAHLYIHVSDARQIPELGKRLATRLWNHGHGWVLIAKNGKPLLRNLLDEAVWQPERLDYAGAHCEPPLMRRAREPRVWNVGLPPLDVTRIEPLAEAEVAAAAERMRLALEAAAPEAARVQAAYVEELVAKGVDGPEAERRVVATQGGVLPLDWELQLATGEVLTVAELLAEPQRYHKARMHDPIEWDYGGRRGDRRIAVAYLRDGEPRIYSHAHGGTVYLLERDAEAILSEFEDVSEDEEDLFANLPKPEPTKPTFSVPRPIGFKQTFLDAVEPPPMLIEDFMPVDVFAWVGTGGIAKTTLMLFIMIHVVLGLPVFGRRVLRQGPCVFVTAEDDLLTVRYRVREMCIAMGFSEEQRMKVGRDLYVEDLSGEMARFVEADDRGNLDLTPAVDQLIEVYRATHPGLVVIDPIVFFGAGERFVNDNEATLLQALRRISRELACATGGIAHTSKQVARDKVVDAHAGRGGSALGDNARGVYVLHVHDRDSKDEKLVVPPQLRPEDIAAGRVIRIHVPKLSGRPRPLQPIWIVRGAEAEGWRFQHVSLEDAVAREAAIKEQAERKQLEKETDLLRHVAGVYLRIEDDLAKPTRVLWTKSALRGQEIWVGGRKIGKDYVVAAVDYALAHHYLEERLLPPEQRRGRKQNYLAPGPVEPPIWRGEDDGGTA